MASLEGVKVGDWLARELSSGAVRICQVVRVTPQRAYFTQDSFARISDGFAPVMKDRYRIATAEEVNAQKLVWAENLKASEERQARENTPERVLIRTILGFFEDADQAERLGLDRLRQIAAWIEEAKGTPAADGVDAIPCKKGGFHEWRTDGQHSNEFCGKCFVSKPVSAEAVREWDPIEKGA